MNSELGPSNRHAVRCEIPNLSTKPNLAPSTLYLLIPLLACAAGVPLAGAAQDSSLAGSEKQLIDWYYAAFFGTGVYRSGDRTVSVVQLPFSKALQPLAESRARVRLTLPISVGFYDFHFDELLGGRTPHSLSTVSVLPGVEVDMPVTHNRTLKPYGSVGKGWDTSGGGAAWIYAAGVKSRVSLPIGTGSELSFGNQLTLSGYKPAETSYQPLGLFVAGLNLSTPSSLRLSNRATSIDLHLIYYYYFNRLRFPASNNAQNKISEQGEFGVSVKTHTPFSLKLFDIDRIGVAFRIGGGTQGVRLFLNLPY